MTRPTLPGSMDVEIQTPAGSLAGRLARPERPPKGALVLLHGFASHLAEFTDAPERLAAKGWLVLALDSRAHGARATVEGTLGHDAVIDDLRAAADLLAKETGPDVPLGLVAHSMGGALACHALPNLPQFKAAVLAAPMDTVRAEISGAEFLGYRIGNVLSRARVRFGLGPLVVAYKNRYEDLFADPEAAARARAHGFLSETISLANYDALLALDGARWAADVTVPTLVILAKRDNAVKHTSSRRVYDALRGPKKLVEVDSGHSMFGDRASTEVIDAVTAWFDTHLSKQR